MTSANNSAPGQTPATALLNAAIVKYGITDDNAAKADLADLVNEAWPNIEHLPPNEHLKAFLKYDFPEDEDPEPPNDDPGPEETADQSSAATPSKDSTPTAPAPATPPIEMAVALAPQQFRILPSGANKQATVRGWGKKDDPHQVATWGPEHFGDAAFCSIICGRCPALGDAKWLLGLDLDGDWQNNPRLVEFIESLPATLTSHGGRHLFFAVPANTELVGSTGLFGDGKSALDLRYRHQLMHERWTWAAGTDPANLASAIVDLPPWALDALRAERATPRTRSTATAGLDEEHPKWWDHDLAVKWATEWLQDKDAPVSVSGEGGSNVALVVAGAMRVGFGLDHETALGLLLDEWNGRCDPVWEENELERKLQKIETDGYSEKYRWCELAGRRHMQAEDNEPAPATTKTPNAVHSDHTKQQRHNGSGWPYLLQQGNRFWAHREHEDGGFSYGPHFPAAELDSRIACDLPNANILYTSAKDLKQTYVRPVDEDKVRLDYRARRTTYDPKTGVLTTSLNWVDRPAVFHQHVDAWLRALASEDDHPRLLKWIASVFDLDRPAPCLYLAGPPGVGKDLLADGLARVWGRQKPTQMANLLGDFNPGFLTCPLISNNEGFPEGFDFNRFREVLTERSREVNAKFQAPQTVNGCARYMLLANNDQCLQTQRTGKLTPQDRRAIASRLLYIPLLQTAANLLRTYTRDVKDAMASHEIAEHARWLAENVDLDDDGDRMAVLAHGAEHLLEDISANRWAHILREVDNALEQTNAPNAARGNFAGVWLGEGQDMGTVLIHVDTLREACGNDTSQRQVKDFCASYAAAEQTQRKRRLDFDGGVRQCKVRALDLESVRTAIDALG